MRFLQQFIGYTIALAMMISPFISHSRETTVITITDSFINNAIKNDSIPAGDTLEKKEHIHSPRQAAIRSAIVPGLGQIYNKKYWKLPIVYGALGTSAGIFVYNLNWYKRTRFAFKAVVENNAADIAKVHPKLKILVDNRDRNTLSYLRDQYRRDIDYSVLFFVVLWGLNVVDASVDAHLKSFDISPDLGFRFKPGYSEMAGTNGISLVMHIGR